MNDAELDQWAGGLLGLREVKSVVAAALAEDVGRRDLTTEISISPGLWAKARVMAQGEFVVAGLCLARLVFGLVDQQVRVSGRVKEGQQVRDGEELVELWGSAAALLAGERTFLNFFQHLCGIATLARAFVEAVAGTEVAITDTRKTTPGLRLLEKYAARAGGAVNHRYGLDDGILIKNNHITMAGSVAAAVDRARALAPFGMKVEVECGSTQEVEEAISAGAELVLLDNLSPAEARIQIEQIAGRAEVELSGGITLDNVRAYAAARPKRISVGAITHSAQAAPVHMILERADARGQ